jgi:hypothetical protein
MDAQKDIGLYTQNILTIISSNYFGAPNDYANSGIMITVSDDYLKCQNVVWYFKMTSL